MPQPEAKRAVKIIDTKYTVETFGDLLKIEKEAEERLTVEQEIVKRFADKTEDELSIDMEKKRRTQATKLNKIRLYQLAIFAFALFGYFYVYRQFLMPKKVFQSHSYVQACDYLTNHQMVKQLLGKEIHVMMCNGKQYPYRSDFDFELILFGTTRKGKAKIHVMYEKENKSWMLNKIDLFANNAHLKLL